MKKLFLSLFLSLTFLLPFSLIAKPVFAENDYVTTSSEDATSYYDDTYDSSYYYDTYGTDNTTDLGTDAGIFSVLFTGIALAFSLTFGAITYVYMGITLMKIAQKLEHPNPWFAWVPILNMVLIFQLGDKNPLLLLLMLIPGVGAVIVCILGIIATMTICEKLSYDKLLGLLTLVPVANYILSFRNISLGQESTAC